MQLRDIYDIWEDKETPIYLHMENGEEIRLTVSLIPYLKSDLRLANVSGLRFSEHSDWEEALSMTLTEARKIM